jgi:cellulose synthase/poly-beta-1,6-N-acetylglucosamine synthase-like glycosyltransferase
MVITPYLLFLFWIFGFIFLWKVPYPKSTRRFDETSSNISMIIPARNEEKNLGRLLGSLKGQTLKPYEMIVVDDHSEDLTAEIGREAGCIVLSSKELPRAGRENPGRVGKGHSDRRYLCLS